MPHLTFVLMTAMHPNCETCVHRPAVYQAVWAFNQSEPDPPTPEEFERLKKKFLFGATVCAN